MIQSAHKYNTGCACGGSTINNIYRFDPSRTLTLRNQFVADMKRRFTKIKRLIKVSILDNDCFGLFTPDFLAAAEPGQFAFGRTSDKIDGFMKWLQEQVDENVLEVTFRPGGTRGIEQAWSDVYIRSAYQKGIYRARQELKAAGVDIGLDSMKEAALTTAFNQPFHADRVGVIYTRTFEDLKSVTDVMNAQIRRELTDTLTTGLAAGVAEGLGPKQVARNLVTALNDRVDKIGIHRATLIARTEIIRAHHSANIQEYRQAGIFGVSIMAEWLTAGDGRVCQTCSSLSRRDNGFGPGIYTLDQIEGLIPVHVLCRCVALPWNPEWEDKNTIT